MSSERETELAIEASRVVVRRRDRRVVDGVDLSVRRGETIAIVGPNGAGKTTLLKALLGLLPYDGSIRVEGHEVRAMRPNERARAVAYVPQQTRLDSALRVEEVVRQGRFAHAAQADEALEEALVRTGVARLRARSFPTLSLGEQRRVLIARALASGAPSVLLDEPDAFLDVGQALDLFALLAELRADGRALVLVLHDLDRAHRFADRALLLHEGRSVSYGPAANALGNEALASAFGVEAIPGAAMGFRRLARPPTEGTPS